MQEQSREYILPCGMSEIQKKVTCAIVNSNFSEILSFFDSRGTPKSKEQLTTKLHQMMIDLSTVATHPLLLLEHLRPNLTSRRAPAVVENTSSKFHALVQICKKFANPRHNVAIICAAGVATDMTELLLHERGIDVTRYSASDNKIFKKDAVKKKGAQFHILPSDLRDLRTAVYAAFDAMIIMDSTFDVTTPYGRGLRMQLRDPNVRDAYASVIRLVPQNSVDHIRLQKKFSFENAVAAAVVNRKSVGALDANFKQLYVSDFQKLNQFFADPDKVCPLPPLPDLKRVTQKEVEIALYLDNEDQYQVNYTDRRALTAKSNAETEPVQVEPPTEDRKEELEAFNEHAPSLKRRAIDLQDEAITLCQTLSASYPLSVNLLLSYNDAVSANKRRAGEIEDHRRLAAQREEELQKVRDDNLKLGLAAQESKAEIEKQKSVIDKLMAKVQTVSKELEQSQAWWRDLENELGSETLEAQVSVLKARVQNAEQDTQRAKDALESERTRFRLIKETSDASSEYANQLTQENKDLTEHNSELKAKLQNQKSVREAVLKEHIREQNSLIAEMSTELANLKAVPASVAKQPRGKGRPAKNGARGRGRPPGSTGRHHA